MEVGVEDIEKGPGEYLVDGVADKAYIGVGGRLCVIIEGCWL
jgi:hypothetical protein